MFSMDVYIGCQPHLFFPYLQLLQNQQTISQKKRGWKEGWGRRYKTFGRLKAPFLLIWKPNHLNLEDGGCRLKAFPNNLPRWSEGGFGAAWGFAIAESSKPSGNCHHPSATNPTLMITNGKIRGKKQESDSKVGVLHEPSATNPTASSREESKKSTED